MPAPIVQNQDSSILSVLFGVPQALADQTKEAAMADYYRAQAAKLRGETDSSAGDLAYLMSTGMPQEQAQFTLNNPGIANSMRVKDPRTMTQAQDMALGAKSAENISDVMYQIGAEGGVLKDDGWFFDDPLYGATDGEVNVDPDPEVFNYIFGQGGNLQLSQLQSLASQLDKMMLQRSGGTQGFSMAWRNIMENSLRDDNTFDFERAAQLMNAAAEAMGIPMTDQRLAPFNVD